jgi:hypothetical protein
LYERQRFINHLKPEVRLNNIQRFSQYLKENTTRHHNKAQFLLLLEERIAVCSENIRNPQTKSVKKSYLTLKVMVHIITISP